MDSKQKEEKSSSVDIKARNVEAPTPNNTPIFTAPISKAPSAAKTSEETKKADNSAALAALQNAMQRAEFDRDGEDSLANLPKSVIRRIGALENIQEKHTELEAQLRDEILALEKKYHAFHVPLYEKRAKIISGSIEPTDEEAKRPELIPKIEEILDEAEEEKKAKEDTTKGIPEFWLSALKNNEQIAAEITADDEDALKHLVDIRFAYLDDNPGFRLEFEFANNDYFTNQVLTKTYFLTNTTESGYDETLYDHAEGCEIKWKADKNLTVKVETKKQRNKNTKKVRTIKKVVPAESFFNFFSPPKMPEDKEEDDEDDEEEDDEAANIEEKLHNDYEIGDIIKSKIIPHAVDWFTGKALQYEDDEDGYGAFMDQFGDEEDEDDEDDEDNDGEEADPKANAQDCKQQ